MRKVLTTIIICLLTSAAALSKTASDVNAYSYGLRFNSVFEDPDLRTGLDLSYEEDFNFKDGFELSFDVKLDFGIGQFGYIFRIVCGNDTNLDLVAGPNRGEASLVIQKNHTLIGRAQIDNGLKDVSEDWVNIKLKVLPKIGATLKISDAESEINCSIDNLENTRIMFGRNTMANFELSDVPPMLLKDIEISDKEGDPLFVWRMMKHNGDVVLDALHGRAAICSNGEWMMDKYAYWKKVAETSVHDKNVQIATDRLGQRIFIASPLQTTIVYLPGGETITSQVKGNGAPIMDCGNQMIYDEGKDRLICYSRITDETTVYDPKKNSWSRRFWEEWPQMYHSAVVVNQDSRKMLSFGGYGNHVYNSDLIVRDLDTWKSRRFSLAGSISPRYLASIGYVGDSLIVFGGYGTVSGQQVDSPYPYKDILALNTENKTVHQIGTIPESMTQVAFSSTMIADERENEVLSLGYDNRKYNAPVTLVGYNIKTQEMRTFGNEIPFKFHDVESYVDLMFSADSTAIYAVIRNAKVGEDVACEVWSIAYPPIAPEFLTQSIDNSKIIKSFILPVSIVAAILILGIIIFLTIRGIKRKNTIDKYLEGKNSDSEQYEISLLGGIQIFNKNREDITAKVRPIVRNILAFCLFGEANNGKGTSSEALENAFWPGMEKVSAGNNRNVNIRKLRICLEEFSDASLVYSNNIFHLNLGKTAKCDYIELMDLLNRADFKVKADKELLGKILDIAKRGQLIPEISESWLDPFKDAYVSKLLKVLDEARKNPVLAEDNILMLRLADVVLIQDSIDEDAIEMKCRIYKSLGRYGFAQQVYNNYREEYFKMMGEYPQKS